MVVYKSFTDTTLTYDATATSTTLFINVDDNFGTISLAGKNFKSYDALNGYIVRTTLTVSSNGWVSYYAQTAKVSGSSTQTPTNVIKLFGFNLVTTVKYYFDPLNNLYLSITGYNYVSIFDTLTTLNKLTLIAKITPSGMISVYYNVPAFGSNPAVGFVGNNSVISTDDIIYTSYNGSGAYDPANLHNKVLVFDATGNFLTSKLSITPTITLSVPSKTYGDLPFTITASSDSRGVITYTSSNQNVATIIGNIVTIVGAGSATITAFQATDSNYLAASKDTTLTVGKKNPIITLNVPSKTYGDSSFTITASSSSTGAFSYTSNNESVATIIGNIVTIVGAGSATITAFQATDSNYLAASKYTTLTVGKKTPIITLSVPSKTYGELPFTIIASSDSTGVITYTSSNQNVATII